MSLDSKKVLQFVQLAADLIGAYQQKNAQDQARHQQLAELAPRVADALVQHRRIREGERDKAASELQDPIRALEVLGNLASQKTDEQLAHLGQPEGPKQAAANGNHNPNYLGNRAPSGELESDRVWLNRLGIS